MSLTKEPLFHFAVAGALLYGAHAWLERGSTDDGASRIVRISRSEVDWLEESWRRQWQRPPTEDELRGMIRDLLEEELLSREARELGLDDNDTVIRRRLAQKMTFLVEDTARLEDPSEDELRRMHAAGTDTFGSPARISFAQVFFSRDRRGDRTEADALERLAELSKGGSAAAPEGGDPFLLQDEFVLEEEPALAGMFGGEFARAVLALEPGRWQGPVASGYGLHLVRVSERREATPRAFEEVRDRVLEAWRREQQAAAEKRYFDALLEKYEIVADPAVSPLLPPLPAAARKAP